MSTHEFLVLYACVLVTMLISRCVPLFVLKGRDLPPRVSQALGLIPPAAFAALVANDLFLPTTLAQDPIAGIMPFVAAAPVVLVSKRTGSLIWSATTGMVAYAVLIYARTML